MEKMRAPSRIPRLKSSTRLTRQKDQTEIEATVNCSATDYCSNSTARRRNDALKESTNIEKRDPENPDQNGSCFSLPILVDREAEELKQEKVQDDQSHYSLKRYTTLPPILSDTNPRHPISFMVPHSSNSKPVRKRLPPIGSLQAEEKPDRVDTSERRKETMRSKIEDEREHREMRRKTRLKDHEKKRKEIDESYEANRLRVLETHRNKLELADRNKDQIRLQRKRKLEYQEERRRRAREKLCLQQKLWIEDSDDEDIAEKWTHTI